MPKVSSDFGFSVPHKSTFRTHLCTAILEFSTKLQDEVMRFKFKGGAAVDPESGLEAEASVMRDSDGTPMTAVLGMVDLVKGNNSYYRSVGLYVHPFYHFWEVLSNGYIAMYISSYLDVRRLTGV